jgi:hypothetical protein
MNWVDSKYKFLNIDENDEIGICTVGWPDVNTSSFQQNSKEMELLKNYGDFRVLDNDDNFLILWARSFNRLYYNNNLIQYPYSLL